MPYVKEKVKEVMGQGVPASNVGELNYAITKLAIRFVTTAREVNYETLNNTYGAMKLAAEEFKRRVIDPYEDRKISENGDVYPPELLNFVNKGVWEND